MAETQPRTLQDLRAMGAGAARPAEDAPAKPLKDSLGRSYATGKRKNAVARVWVKPGTGKITVNGRDQEI